jgi:CubicO group peptidase (beta-lactamase class C family)
VPALILEKELVLKEGGDGRFCTETLLIPGFWVPLRERRAVPGGIRPFASPLNGSFIDVEDPNNVRVGCYYLEHMAGGAKEGSFVSPNSTNLAAETKARIDAVFAPWDRADSPGCALGIVQDGELAYARGYGMSNLEHGVPITPASIFHVASISKQFTALTSAILAQQGHVNLDGDVREYLPELPNYGQTITWRQMIHHVSGLRDMWDLLRMAGWRADDLITFDDVLEIVPRQTSLNFAAGSEHLYSNSGYALQSVIIQRVTGKSLRENADELIFQPLGMSNTHFHNDHTEIVPNRTQAYLRRDGGGYKISIPAFDVDGTTSLFTTVEDMVRWDGNFYEPRIGADLIETIQQPGTLNDGSPLDYAFGLRVRAYRGARVVEHSGGDAGYRAHYLRLPEQRFSIICLCNLSEMQPRLLCERVLDIVLENRLGRQSEHETVDLAADELERCAAIYRNTRTGDLMRLRMDEGKLVLGFNGKTELTPIGDGRFQVGEDRLLTLEIEGASLRQRIGALGVNQVQTFERLEPCAPSASELGPFSGAYVSEELGARYCIVVEDGTLKVRQRKYSDRSLEPAFPDAFGNDNVRLVFERGASGQVSGFKISTMRVRDVAFVRE